MRVASFFSGIGGFDLGLERAGMKISFQCEINSFSRLILRKHWPHVYLHDDISTLEAELIPECDLWCAGFPCQDVSLANQGKRQGLKGERSGLFFKFAELIERKRPTWVLMENVPGLLNSQGGKDFSTLISKLDEFGYGVAWRVLDAKFFGTPQRRRRVFIVASYRSPRATQILFDDRPAAIIAQSSKSEEQDYSVRLRSRDSETNLYTLQHASIGRHDKAGPQAKGYRNDGETWTLDSRGSSDAVCAPYDAFRIRETPGFPGGVDDAITGVNELIGGDTGEGRGDSNRYRCIGNAVAVPVIEWLGKRIMQQETDKMIDEKHPFSFRYPQEIPLQMELFIK